MTDPRLKPEVSAWVKVQTALLAGVLILLAILVIVIGMTARRVEKSLDLVQTDLEALQVERINKAVDALSEAAGHMAEVDISRLNETAKSLKSAAESLADVDIDTLNGAIASLKDAANTLKDLDTQALNGVIQAIDKSVKGLENAVNTLKGLFG